MPIVTNCSPRDAMGKPPLNYKTRDQARLTMADRFRRDYEEFRDRAEEIQAIIRVGYRKGRDTLSVSRRVAAELAGSQFISII